MILFASIYSLALCKYNFIFLLRCQTDEIEKFEIKRNWIGGIRRRRKRQHEEKEEWRKKMI